MVLFIYLNLKKIMGVFNRIEKKVDAFIIGAQKSATTALFSYLIKHPQIQGSSVKEIHYFDNYYEKGDQWYMSHFKPSSRNKILLEATPRYLYFPEIAKRIYQFNPKAKLILMLRDPVDRAYSAWNMYRQMASDSQSVKMWQEKGKLNKKHQFYKLYVENGFPTFEEAMKLELDALNSLNFLEPSILRRGLYKKQIQSWLEYFPSEQFFITTNKSIEFDLADNLSKLSSFLHLHEFDWDMLSLTRVHERTYETTLDAKTRKFYQNFYQKENHDLLSIIQGMNQPKELCLD